MRLGPAGGRPGPGSALGTRNPFPPLSASISPVAAPACCCWWRSPGKSLARPRWFLVSSANPKPRRGKTSGVGREHDNGGNMFIKPCEGVGSVHGGTYQDTDSLMYPLACR